MNISKFLRDWQDDNLWRVVISKAMCARAGRDSAAMGILKDSYTQGEGNMTGFLAEEMYWHIFPHSQRVSHADKVIDFILVNKKTADVKGRDFNAPLLPEYEFVVYHPDNKDFSRLDYFIFFGVHTSHEYGFYIGWLEKEVVFNKPRVKKGSPLPQGGGVYRCDGHSVLISEIVANRKNNPLPLLKEPTQYVTEHGIVISSDTQVNSSRFLQFMGKEPFRGNEQAEETYLRRIKLAQEEFKRTGKILTIAEFEAKFGKI